MVRTAQRSASRSIDGEGEGGLWGMHGYRGVGPISSEEKGHAT